MDLKLNLDPTTKRVIAVAALIFVYALTAQTGLLTTLADRMPEPREWLLFIFAALGTDVVYLMTFLGIAKPEKEG
jgi:hypothetical protein